MLWRWWWYIEWQTNVVGEVRKSADFRYISFNRFIKVFQDVFISWVILCSSHTSTCFLEVKFVCEGWSQTKSLALTLFMPLNLRLKLRTSLFSCIQAAGIFWINSHRSTICLFDFVLANFIPLLIMLTILLKFLTVFSALLEFTTSILVSSYILWVSMIPAAT